MAATKTDPRYCLKIYWSDPGTRDYFEHGSLAKLVTSAVGQHRVDQGFARFVSTVVGNQILLDYRHPRVLDFNISADMEPGFIRLTLQDARVVNVEWLDKARGPVSAEEPIWTWFDIPDPGTYSFTKKKGKKLLVPRALREAQSRLKEQVLQAYGARCCISGCAVAAALDAAHLDEAGFLKREHPRNSLLLRADLHRLLDANLLGIDPEKRTVHLAAITLSDPAFSPFAGRVVRSPSVGWEKYGPDPAALARKWKTFLQGTK